MHVYALESVYVCGFPPSFSQKEKSHVHSLTRPGRGSIATSWPPVWSKVNIWREATVKAGTWGQLFSSPLPPTRSTPPTSPLYLSNSMPYSCTAVGHPSLRARDCQLCCFWIGPAGWLGSVRWSLSWDRLSRESASLSWLVLFACCGLTSLRALKDHRQRQANPGPYTHAHPHTHIYIHIFIYTAIHTQSTSPSLCKLSGIWFSFRALCAR